MDKSICIIPARGGSKRIYMKNIRLFHGKPIVAYSIEAALNSGIFEEVMVSTDNEEIKEIALTYGAKVPFLRSDENSDDFATTLDVIVEVLEGYKRQKRNFDICCCLYATAPFVTPHKLQDAYKKMMVEDLYTIFPVVPFDYPVQKALVVKNHRVSPFYSNFKNSRTQDLEDIYHDAGQFYFCRGHKLLKKEGLFGDKAGIIVVDRKEAHDINNELDWKIAEMKYQFSNDQKNII